MRAMDHGHNSYTYSEKVKVKGHSVQKLEWNGWRDGQTEAIALSTALKRSIIKTEKHNDVDSAPAKWCKLVGGTVSIELTILCRFPA